MTGRPSNSCAAMRTACAAPPARSATRRRRSSPPSSRTLPRSGASTVPEVIVVEDDPALAELLTFGLEARGYRFRHFRNGREALDLLKTMDTRGSVQPPLLLLDVDLPALDGYSIFEELQKECPGKFRVARRWTRRCAAGRPARRHSPACSSACRGCLCRSPSMRW